MNFETDNIATLWIWQKSKDVRRNSEDIYETIYSRRFEYIVLMRFVNPLADLLLPERYFKELEELGKIRGIM